MQHRIRGAQLVEDHSSLRTIRGMERGERYGQACEMMPGAERSEVCELVCLFAYLSACLLACLSVCFSFVFVFVFVRVLICLFVYLFGYPVLLWVHLSSSPSRLHGAEICSAIPSDAQGVSGEAHTLSLSMVVPMICCTVMTHPFSLLST